MVQKLMVLELFQKDNIFLGKYLLKIDGRAKDLSDELAISAIGIEKVYPNQKKGKKHYIKWIFQSLQRSLLAIMGPLGVVNQHY